MDTSTTWEYIMEISIHADHSAKGLLKGPYYNKRSQDTLRRLRSPGGVLVSGWTYEVMQQQGFELNAEVDNKSAFEPMKLFDALGRYAERTTFNPDQKLWDLAERATFDAFGSKGYKLSVLSGKQDLYSAIKLEKASGAPYFMKKADSFEKDFEIFERVKQGTKAPEPCVAGKRVQHGATGPKTRLVWSYPLSMTLLEAQFARPLINHFVTSRTPMAFGLQRMHLAARLVRVTNSGTRVGLDYSGFDSSIHPRLISLAFSVLRTHFGSFTPEEELSWEKVMHYFIHTPIVMPDSQLYVKHKGVPSGSYFTQMVDSIVNYFAIRYLGYKHNLGFSNDEVMILGDDVVIGCSQSIHLSGLAKTAKEELGLTVNAEKSEITHFGQEYAFLGHAWVQGVVDRDLRDTAKRLAFPESPRPKDMSPREYALVRLFASLFDSKSAWCVYQKCMRGHSVAALLQSVSDQVLVGVFGWQALQTREGFVSEQDYYPNQLNGYTGIFK